MDFSNDLFGQNALVAEKSKTYRIETKDLSFAYDKGNFIVKVPLTNIQGFLKLTRSIYSIPAASITSWRKCGQEIWG